MHSLCLEQRRTLSTACRRRVAAGPSVDWRVEDSLAGSSNGRGDREPLSYTGDLGDMAWSSVSEDDAEDSLRRLWVDIGWNDVTRAVRNGPLRVLASYLGHASHVHSRRRRQARLYAQSTPSSPLIVRTRMTRT